MTVAAGPKTSRTKEAKKPPLVPVDRKITEVRKGDQIVLSVNERTGFVASSLKVEHIVTGEGCRNIHINRSSCWDRCVTVQVAVEPEALDGWS